MTTTSTAVIQRALEAAHFDPGPIDNAWGPKTSRALKAYQTANNLPATGLPNADTLAALLGTTAPLPILWLDEAERLLGLKEGAGAKDNATILDWADDLDIHFAADSIAWCGLFIAHVIRVALPSEPLPGNPLGARNYLKLGTKVKPQVGAVGVFWRGTKDGWQGHVGLLVAESATSYCVLGGNQSDSVSYAWIAKSRLLETRWPVSGSSPLNLPLPSKPGGVLSTNEA